MAARKRLTKTEFDAVRLLLEISDDRVNAAYYYLVVGETCQAVADRYGWTRQYVFKTVKTVMLTFKRYQDANDVLFGKPTRSGWERLVLSVPIELASKFRKEVSIFVKRNAGDD